MAQATSEDEAATSTAEVNDERRTIDSGTLQDPWRALVVDNFKRKKFLESLFVFRLMHHDKNPVGKK